MSINYINRLNREIYGTSGEDSIQGFFDPRTPTPDLGRSQFITGFSSSDLALYGLDGLRPFFGQGAGANPDPEFIGNYEERSIPISDGDDTINGGGGNDTLIGGTGDDLLIGGVPGGEGSDDYIIGGWGDDILIGGNSAETSDGGNDTLIGGPGDDVFNGMSGNNVILGGRGTDVAFFPRPKSAYSISYDEGVWTIGEDKLNGVEYAIFDTERHLSPAEAKALYDDFDPNSSENPNIVKLAPYIFLDASTQIPYDLQPLRNNDVIIGFEPVQGSMDLGFFDRTSDADELREIADTVLGFFQEAEIDVVVTTERPPISSGYVTVLFTSERFMYGATLNDFKAGQYLGENFDPYSVPDKYNSVANDFAAVYLDRTPGDDGRQASKTLISEAIAHEVAHAFGARHVNPKEGNLEEILDYHWDANEPKFTTVPVDIKEPPIDGEGPLSSYSLSPFSTHNPTYHIRVFGVGEESPTGLTSIGAPFPRPGRYDRAPEYRIDYQLKITIDTLGAGIDRIFGNVSSGSNGPVMQELGVYTDVDEEIDFSVRSDHPLRLFASSDSSDDIDVVFQFDVGHGRATGIWTGQEDVLTGRLIVFGGIRDGEIVGSFDLEVEDRILTH